MFLGYKLKVSFEKNFRRLAKKMRQNTKVIGSKNYYKRATKKLRADKTVVNVCFISFKIFILTDIS